ncbi:hypothetical protein QTJ16_004575 [Diplocarpon rosae]|uniref:Uncharacterized protein n=1 Tax=Diplocarpon rosae TaxID=946125 RepID=A0AAD9WDM9_9HELO|nr:hypothetical protein QTJ16_004575 [Diplocarpon rosae]
MQLPVLLLLAEALAATAQFSRHRGYDGVSLATGQYCKDQQHSFCCVSQEDDLRFPVPRTCDQVQTQDGGVLTPDCGGGETYCC